MLRRREWRCPAPVHGGCIGRSEEEADLRVRIAIIVASSSTMYVLKEHARSDTCCTYKNNLHWYVQLAPPKTTNNTHTHDTRGSPKRASTKREENRHKEGKQEAESQLRALSTDKSQKKTAFL